MTVKRKDNIWCYLATVFPLGKAPVAPGTFGSLAGIPLALLCQLCFDSWVQWLGFIVLFCILSWWVIQKTEDFWNTHDDKSIVIDEVAGQLIALAPSGLTLWEIVIGFAAFRVLDIWKPGPIGWCDRKLNNSFGTLIDDVFCGLIVGLGFYLFHNMIA